MTKIEICVSGATLQRKVENEKEGLNSLRVTFEDEMMGIVE
jgi:hypothetical protein